MISPAGPTGEVVDHAALRDWMDGQGLGSGPLTELRPLPGGTQNIMVTFERAGRSYVLRRGPEHLRSGSNATLLREMTILDALAATDVPHARIVGTCRDPDVLHGAVFYLMEPVDGFNARVELPPLWERDASVRRRAGFALVDALAALGTVDHAAVGLTDFGRPDGFLERQVDRWMAQLDGYAALPGYTGPGVDGIDGIADWLSRNRPTAWSPGILHGDYHVANVMFAHGRPAVAAIVDWELSTIGDPLLDLGQLLALWPTADGEADLIGSALSEAGGLPAAHELVDRYRERSVRDVSAIDWYVVLACFRLAILLEGTHARAGAGRADRATGESLHHTAVRLFERARHRAAGWSA